MRAGLRWNLRVAQVGLVLNVLSLVLNASTHDEVWTPIAAAGCVICGIGVAVLWHAEQRSKK